MKRYCLVCTACGSEDVEITFSQQEEPWMNNMLHCNDCGEEEYWETDLLG